ncbi:MAG: Glycosyltransferase [uncultured Sulfurovum sp.]|uniref:Glycosyltransferase n=1 Tax=uncultured Sulfurovum sp. TaxID=269237 RepID=A0A6S6T073_9BACT|nr:MAG: Glycosyltransferase [uncultured Sulfurovum sp.]
MGKYLHVFSDAPYTEKFIRFIEKYFDPNEHEFIILCQKQSKFLDFYKQRKNCKVTYTKNIYFNFKDLFKHSKKIIIHQLNKPILMLSLIIFYKKAFKKMVWSIWGGDVYFYKYKSNSFKDNMIELLRKIVIAKIPLISYWIKGDYLKVKEVYKSKAKGIKAKYPSPIDIAKIENIKLDVHKQEDPVRIFVGNSADPSNEHIETFKLLQKFQNENIEVVSVLSYGGSEHYREEVMATGKEFFKNKFKPISTYMNFNEYLSFINSMDICVFNHKRQQGLGNQLVFFILEKKVFISHTTTPFSTYKDLGIDIYSTEDIVKLDFQNFITQSKDKKKESRRLTLEDMSEECIMNEWNEVFNA